MDFRILFEVTNQFKDLAARTMEPCKGEIYISSFVDADDEDSTEYIETSCSKTAIIYRYNQSPLLITKVRYSDGTRFQLIAGDGALPDLKDYISLEIAEGELREEVIPCFFTFIRELIYLGIFDVFVVSS